jgi:hypothetical protein
MRDPPEAAVSQADFCRGERTSDFPADVKPVARPPRVQPCRDDPHSAVRFSAKCFTERLVTAFIRGLAAWPT